MAARAAVEFSRILQGLQVVGHRDYGEKDHDEHRQRGSLCARTSAVAASMKQP